MEQEEERSIIILCMGCLTLFLYFGITSMYRSGEIGKSISSKILAIVKSVINPYHTVWSRVIDGAVVTLIFSPIACLKHNR